ncbi:two-component system response regulator [Streptomyces sp. NPDC087300]|uniref:response regulator n=1 Tax=Streptomyces sp. NPDC087300 TaxID=3365780 RepID=UPI0037F972EF
MTPGAKILIVDDDADTLFALESALVHLRYELISATNGEDALRHLLRGEIGLVLLDVRMPGTDGLDVVRFMRRLEQTQHIPVVLLTGFGVDHELASSAFALGVADVVRKPVDPWMLPTKVRYLYESHEYMRALRRELAALRADRSTDPPRGHRSSASPERTAPQVPEQPTATSRPGSVLHE